jgi:hemolysin type calcium-binding protein
LKHVEKLYLIPLSIAALGLGVIALSEQPVAAQQAIVPDGCGDYSGLPVPPDMFLDDHSGDPGPLSGHHTLLRNGVITVGTRFSDHIIGNGVSEVICGGEGNDLIEGGAGDDEVFGGRGNDVLYGQANEDTIEGGPGDDEIHGDEPGNPSFFDEGDTLRGGRGDDILFGGRGDDELDGGPHDSGDFGDGEDGNDTCSAIEDGPC